MHFTAALLVTALAAVPAFALDNNPDHAEAVILKDSAAQNYCWDLLNKTPKPTTKTITKSAVVTKVSTITETETARVTKTINGDTVTFTAPGKTMTVSVTSTSKSPAQTTFQRVKRGTEPTAIARRAAEPSSLKKFTNSAVSKGCQQAFAELDDDVTKTVTKTATKSAKETVDARVTQARTMTKDDVTITKSGATATKTATKTVVSPSAVVTAHALALRSRSGALGKKVNIGGNDYLTTSSGDKSWVIFMKTGSSGSYDKGYFVDATDSSLCLKQDTYVVGYLYFAPCGKSPQSFYVDDSDYGFVSPSAAAYGAVSSAGKIYLTTDKTSPALSWAADNE